MFSYTNSDSNYTITLEELWSDISTSDPSVLCPQYLDLLR